jgi:hypothetical protein
MEVVSFARFFGARSVGAAPWYLNWSPSSVGRDFRGSLRLYLNGDDAEFIRRVQEQDALTLQAIMGDVVTQVTEALLSDSLLSAQLEDAEDGTLGSEAVYWLVRTFSSIELAQSMLEQRPGEFRASMLASVRLT